MTSLILIVIIILMIVVLAMVLRLSMLYRNLNESFSKIGYVLREDMKKLWEYSQEKYIAMQQNYSNENQEVLKKAIDSVIADQQAAARKTFFEAQEKAQGIIGQAKDQAERIKSESLDERKKILDNACEKSAYIIEQVLSEYAGSNFTVSDHEEIIKKLMREFMDNE